MSNAQHAPRPWQVHPASFGIYPSNTLDVSKRIATVDTCACIEQEKANARLIAAAPELLEALEMVMAKYSKHLDNFAFEQCHSVIAKAKGE